MQISKCLTIYKTMKGVICNKVTNILKQWMTYLHNMAHT